jgi:hypothetical protein
VRPEKISGKAKLVAITQVDETPCLEIETEIVFRGGGIHNFIKGLEHLEVAESRKKIWTTTKRPLGDELLPYERDQSSKGFNSLRGKASLETLRGKGKAKGMRGAARRLRRMLKRRTARTLTKKTAKHEAELKIHSDHQSQLEVRALEENEVAKKATR